MQVTSRCETLKIFKVVFHFLSSNYLGKGVRVKIKAKANKAQTGVYQDHQKAIY